MFKNVRLLFLLLIIATSLRAQVLPREGSSLNYRIIGFSFASSSQAAQPAQEYKLEIAAGNYMDVDSFKQHIIKTVVDKGVRIIAEVPSFGKQYTWQVTYAEAHAGTELHHFTTAIVPAVDTALTRLRILTPATKYQDAYVFLDGIKALYDMKGQPVWFLPKADSQDNIQQGISDLKLSPQGTITFLRNGKNVCEVNYNGHILWKGPDNGDVNMDTTEHYHHEFTRLGNGHYMALGNEAVSINIDSVHGGFTFTNTYDKRTKKYTDGKKIIFATVIEYDEKGAAAWYWNSDNYFKKFWLLYSKQALNFYIDAHANAFFLDEKRNYLYVSFKNIGHIVKIKYPEGNVVADYAGETPLPETDTSRLGKVLFCTQHACKISEQGYLYFFDNNGCQPNGHPKIVIAKEPRSKKDNLEEIWEYEDTTTQEPVKNTFDIRQARVMTVGGNVIELPDHAIFASMCNPSCNVLIVTREKQVLWNAICEKWDARKKTWNMVPQYRASIIKSRKELEQLVWNAERDR